MKKSLIKSDNNAEKKKAKNVVICGGYIAGINCAKILQKKMKETEREYGRLTNNQQLNELSFNKNSIRKFPQLNIILIDQGGEKCIGAAIQFVLAGTRNIEEVIDLWESDNINLDHNYVKFVQATIDRIDIKNKKVFTRDPIFEFSYDDLVLAAGVQSSYYNKKTSIINQLKAAGAYNICSLEDAARLREALTSQKNGGWKGGKIVVAIATLPYKCPPIGHEMCFVLDNLIEGLDESGEIRKRTEIIFSTGMKSAIPADYPEIVQEGMNECNIKYKYNVQIKSIDKDKKVVHYSDGSMEEFDILYSTFPQEPPKFITTCGSLPKNPLGFVGPINGRTHRIPGCPGVYAIGDCASIYVDFKRKKNPRTMHPKAGGFARLQGEFVGACIAETPIEVSSSISLWDDENTCPFKREPGSAFDEPGICPLEGPKGSTIPMSVDYFSHWDGPKFFLGKRSELHDLSEKWKWIQEQRNIIFKKEK